MASNYTRDSKAYQKALQIGRPPNIVKLFPESQALIVSGKYIDLAMLTKGRAIAMAANGRSHFVIRGALLAAQQANACLIVEIARSEGGAGAYCAVNYWNIARQVNAACNELGITIPVAIHADHYGIKKEADIEPARMEIPTIFEAGMTSIAIDASHIKNNVGKKVEAPKHCKEGVEEGNTHHRSQVSNPGQAVKHLQIDGDNNTVKVEIHNHEESKQKSSEKGQLTKFVEWLISLLKKPLLT